MIDEICRESLNYAIKQGADEAEIYVYRGNIKTIRIEGERVYPSIKDVFNVAVRVSIGKKVGSIFTSTVSSDILKVEIDKAISFAKGREEDPYWSGLPDPAKPIHKNRSFDDRFLSIELDDMAKENLDIINSVKNEHPDLNPFEVANEVVIWERWIFNSRGIEAYDRGTTEEFFLNIKGKDTHREISMYDYEMSTSYIDNKLDISLNLANRIKGLYNAEKLREPLRCSIVFHPKTIAEILYFVFTRAITASNVQEGRSPLAGKIDTKIGCSELTIIDNGMLPNGLMTTLYDAEGVPREKTLVVNKGTLCSFIYDTYTARRENRESTGNAVRAGGSVTIGHSNLIIAGSNISASKLISSVDKGIYVEGFSLNPHSSNFITGEINAVLYDVHLIRRGSIEKPLFPLNLSGNIYDAFKELQVAGKPVQTPYSIYSPYILLHNLTVV